jgi:hypothetical protein
MLLQPAANPKSEDNMAVGVNFSSQTRTIESWEITEIIP